MSSQVQLLRVIRCRHIALSPLRMLAIQVWSWRRSSVMLWLCRSTKSTRSAWGFHVDSGSLISAIAASAAAVFAGVNLWISGRREHSQWARQALVESLVEFMNASFNVTRACAQGRQLGKQEGRQGELQELKQKTEDALHEMQMPIVTRLRLLCPPGVADAALVLHAQDHVRIALTFERNRFRPDAFKQARETAWRDLREARVSMINEARAALRLPRNARFPAFDEDPEVRALRSLNDARQPASP